MNKKECANTVCKLLPADARFIIGLQTIQSKFETTKLKRETPITHREWLLVSSILGIAEGEVKIRSVREHALQIIEFWIDLAAEEGALSKCLIRRSASSAEE